jgi:hypothetical protein
MFSYSYLSLLIHLFKKYTKTPPLLSFVPLSSYFNVFASNNFLFIFLLIFLKIFYFPPPPIPQLYNLIFYTTPLSSRIFFPPFHKSFSFPSHINNSFQHTFIL